MLGPILLNVVSEFDLGIGVGSTSHLFNLNICDVVSGWSPPTCLVLVKQQTGTIRDLVWIFNFPFSRKIARTLQDNIIQKEQLKH